MIRILIVDDSAYHRRTLQKIIDADPQMEVIGLATDGEDAIKKVVNLKPDLITLDLEMPRMDGFTFLRWLMRSFPRPVLVVTSRESNRSVFRALELGAVDFVVKPVKYASMRLATMEEDIISKIKEVSSLRVETLQARMESDSDKKEEVVRDSFTPGKRQLVAIGASTGGPPALQSILSRLPRGLSAGIVISQHMPEGFTRLFAERLDRLVAFKVKEAENGDTVEFGKALIAPGGKHLLLRKKSNGKVTVALRKATSSDHYTPSIDQMMISAAEIYGESMMGVLLTGMGDDGVLGLKAVKGGDGKTVAESEDTCIVFGMPREAQRAGVVDKMMPLGEIGPSIIRECSG